MQLIPSIDLRGGHCVRLLRGDFERQTLYDVDPRSLIYRYAKLGARWLHLVDLDGAKDGLLANRKFILDLAREHPLALQVGGGVRSAEVVEELLSAGVDRVAVGSTAVERPDEVAGWFARFGAERICLALDIRLEKQPEGTVPRLLTRGWTEGSNTSLWQAIEFFLPHGLRHVLCTDVERDGALEGPNIALYKECVERAPQIAWQASGGVRGAQDLAILQAVGVAASISGKALLEGRLTTPELRQWLGG